MIRNVSAENVTKLSDTFPKKPNKTAHTSTYLEKTEPIENLSFSSLFLHSQDKDLIRYKNILELNFNKPINYPSNVAQINPISRVSEMQIYIDTYDYLIHTQKTNLLAIKQTLSLTNKEIGIYLLYSLGKTSFRPIYHPKILLGPEHKEKVTQFELKIIQMILKEKSAQSIFGGKYYLKIESSFYRLESDTLTNVSTKK